MNTKTGKTRWGWIALIGTTLIAMMAYGTVFAHGGPEDGRGQGRGFGRAYNKDAPQVDKAQWEHMTEMREIMHGAQLKATPTETGVRVTISGATAELQAAIKKEFDGKRHQPTAPAPGVTVTVEPQTNGAVVIYTAKAPETVKWLQARAEQLVYNELRENMHSTMTAQSGSGGWMHRMMGGFSGGRGGYGHMGQGGYGNGGYGHMGQGDDGQLKTP